MIVAVVRVSMKCKYVCELQYYSMFVNKDLWGERNVNEWGFDFMHTCLMYMCMHVYNVLPLMSSRWEQYIMYYCLTFYKIYRLKSYNYCFKHIRQLSSSSQLEDYALETAQTPIGWTSIQKKEGKFISWSNTMCSYAHIGCLLWLRHKYVGLTHQHETLFHSHTFSMHSTFFSIEWHPSCSHLCSCGM